MVNLKTAGYTVTAAIIAGLIYQAGVGSVPQANNATLLENMSNTGCPAGYINGTGYDQTCYPVQCGDKFCNPNETCIDSHCVYCPDGAVMGADNQCHQICGGNLCTNNAVCIDDQCKPLYWAHGNAAGF